MIVRSDLIDLVRSCGDSQPRLSNLLLMVAGLVDDAGRVDPDIQDQLSLRHHLSPQGAFGVGYTRMIERCRAEA